MITVLGFGVGLKEIRKVKPTTPDNAGSRWQPVPHGELVDAILAGVDKRGWVVEKDIYTLAKDRATMAGALLLNNVPGVEGVPQGLTLALGFLNDNTRRKALRLTVGAHVACCANGMCTGEILLNHKHDKTFDLIGGVEAALDQYTTAACVVPATVEAMRNTPISDEQASEALMEAGRRRLIGWAAIGRVDREYRRPTFAEHGKGTAWALLNAFTYAARKNILPTKQMEVYNTFRSFLPGCPDLN